MIKYEKNCIRKCKEAITVDEIKTIKNIMPSYNKNLIYSRLGYSKNSTELSLELTKEIESIIEKAKKALQITVAYRIMKIIDIDYPNVKLADGTILSGQKLSKLLENSQEALIMAATGGHNIMKLIVRLQKEERLSEAVIADAAASVMTDSALDFTMNMVNQQLRSKGRLLTKMRFSPGYGDFDISQQKDFYRLLKCENLGLVLNDAYMLIPEKSVFAVAGISC